MTDQRLLVLRYIVEYSAQHHFSPSHRDICEYVDTQRPRLDNALTSTSTVRFHLRELHKMEYIYYEQGVSRGYAPTQKGMDLIREMYLESEVKP